MNNNDTAAAGCVTLLGCVYLIGLLGFWAVVLFAVVKLALHIIGTL